MKRIDFKSFKFQIIAFISCIVLALLVALSYSYQAIVKYNCLQYDEWCSSKMSQFETVFMEKYYQISNIMTSLGCNELVQRGLVEGEEYSYEVSKPLSMSENLMKIMYVYSELDSSVKDVYLISAEGEMHSYITYHDQEVFSTLIEEMALDSTTETSGSFAINGQETFIMSVPIKRFALSNSYTAGIEEDVIGTCVVTVDMDFLKEQLNDICRNGSSAYLYDPDNNISLSNISLDKDDTILNDTIQSFLKTNQLGDLSILQQDHQITTIKQIGGLGWSLVISSPEKDRMLFELGGFVSVTLIWIVLLICIILICLKLLSGVNGYVAQLIKYMELAGKGDFEVQIPVTEKTEFNHISNGFNTMIGEIGQLTSKNIKLSTDLYQEEVERINATLLALQSQINPHFLYNTIECIKNIGICYDVKEIEMLSTSLSFVLRYTMKQENTVSIYQEMDCVRHYLQIQTIRFENRFSIIYDIDPALENFPILKLCFEPLVENAMKHAFENMPINCELKIRIYQTNDAVYLSVQDNGAGISSEKMQDILSGSGTSTGSIGLSNVMRRLSLFYKDCATLSIQSQQGQGTVVTIEIQKTDEDK